VTVQRPNMLTISIFSIPSFWRSISACFVKNTVPLFGHPRAGKRCRAFYVYDLLCRPR
jgi:hypothetical protein